MEDLLEQEIPEQQENRQDKQEVFPKKPDRLKGACLFVILGVLVCLVCMIVGAVVFSSWWRGSHRDGGWKSDTQVFVLDKEKICEFAFVQQTFLVDTKSEFPWEIGIPLTDDGKIEVGRADVKVKGVYLAKYGMDQQAIDEWKFYPGTRELHISSPQFRLMGVETVFQELDSENESFLKKLQLSERNEAFTRNRDDAKAQAMTAIQSDEKLKHDCVEQLKHLLESFGINLVIVEPLLKPE